MKEKIKKYWEENKDSIKRDLRDIAWYAGGFVVGGFIVTKVHDYRFALGLERIYNAGFIKFFNPENGIEVDLKESCKLISEYNK